MTNDNTNQSMELKCESSNMPNIKQKYQSRGNGNVELTIPLI
jgi:hypothetical protein